MKKTVLLILLLSSFGSSESTQTILLKNEIIELEFVNIKIDEIEFVQSDELIVTSESDIKISTVFKNDVVTITANHEVEMKLYLPQDKTYIYQDEGAQIVFDKEKVTINADDGDEIIFIDGQLSVSDGDGESVVIDKNGIFVKSNDETVVIDSNGIVINSDDEKVEISGFWGKIVGGFIQTITGVTLEVVGKNSTEVMKLIINEQDGEENSNQISY
jgi:hypothetical protein